MKIRSAIFVFFHVYRQTGSQIEKKLRLTVSQPVYSESHA
jgi:hypothetical protein